MRQAARLRWNSLFSLLSAGIRLLTNVLMFLGIARMYGPETFGQFTTAHTLATLFLMLADFGLDVLFTSQVARQRAAAEQLFRSFAAVKLLLVGIAVAGMCLIPLWQSFSPATRWLVYIFSFSVAFNALTNFFYALFKGFEQLQYETQGSFIANLVLLAALVLISIFHAPIWLAALAFTGSRALGLIIAVMTATRFVQFRAPSFTIGELKKVLRQGWSFGLHLLFEVLYFQLDTLLLSLWQGDYEVGIYQSVMKLVVLALMLPDIAINVTLPVLSRLHDEDPQKWEWLGGLLNKTLWLLALPIGLVFIVFAEPVIQIIYGVEKYAPAIPIMRVAGLMIITRFFFATYGVMLMVAGRQKVRMLVVMMATVISLALNAYAIPRHGAWGAIIVSLVANFFVAIAFVLFSRALFKRWTFNARFLWPGALTVILGGMLWKWFMLSWGYAISIALVFYAFIFYFIGYSKDERRAVFFGRE